MSGMHILMVGIGGFFGAIARFTVSKYLNNYFQTFIPIGTMIINLLGAFLLGIIIGAKTDTIHTLLFGTGFIGTFTTFSTLKLEMVQLHINKLKKEFLIYLAITYGGGIALAYLGYLTGKVL
ncbi:fluoride efflux transporter CrcB [Peribacillus simplex]|uniref:fluoride efflux transporter CrcB n=1 Tax=Peribacillus simplex TaxID=1478 RepID=UPI0024C05F43|nr:fluoride efflux transporter CrcB [Peribacillus simplex]WHY95427.1 fluoride efflux transporter CrcB [Peribacillus simplex]